jgi:ribosome biogenesis GTPase
MRHHGRVVLSTGNHCLVADQSGNLYRCQLRRRGDRPVCGDWIEWRVESGGAVVEAIEPRQNVIERGDFRGHPRPLAANVDQVILVIAPTPTPDTLLIDRYRVLSQAAEIPLTVWINKTDRIDSAESRSLRSSLGLDHNRHACLIGSARSGAGLNALRALIGAGTAILVGQSGVGKSSLTQALVPGVDLRVGEISRVSGQGRHTTTETILVQQPRGPALIDSPGVRTLRLDHLSAAQVMAAFPDIAELTRQCRFRDCRHNGEPGCALQRARESGAVPAQRIAHWARLMQETENGLADKKS